MGPTAPADHFHAVRFYKDAVSLAEIVCTFLTDGLRRGAPALIIAEPEHIRVFADCFAAKGVDVAGALRTGSLTLLDASETLARFMGDGLPEAQPFADTLAPVLDSIAARFPGATIRAYGEMVDVLWKHEHTAAAIRLETLWNDLGRSHRFALLCGYAMGHFYKGSATDHICSAHTHVMTDAGAIVPLV